MIGDLTIDGSASGLVLTNPRCGHFVIIASGVTVARFERLRDDFALTHARCATAAAVRRTEYGYPVLCSSG